MRSAFSLCSALRSEGVREQIVLSIDGSVARRPKPFYDPVQKSGFRFAERHAFWIVPAMGQPATGRLMRGPSAHCRDGFRHHVSGSLNGPFIVLFDSGALTSLAMASSLREMPATSLRRLISPFRPSIGLVDDAWPSAAWERSCERASPVLLSLTRRPWRPHTHRKQRASNRAGPAWSACAGTPLRLLRPQQYRSPSQVLRAIRRRWRPQ